MVHSALNEPNSACPCCGRRKVGIDVHAHYYPEAYLKLIEAEGGPFGAKVEDTAKGRTVQVGPLFAGPIHPKFVSIDERLQAMDEQAVAVQALSLTQPMVYWASGELSRRLAIAFNDAVAAAHVAHSTRLVGLAILPMQEPSIALAELERVIRLPGIRGVYMATRIRDQDLSNPNFWPVYERLEDLGLPVFLHPVDVIGMADRLTSYFLSNLLGNPFDTAIAASHLIFGGVLDRFPRLNFVLPHGGGALPYLIGRIEHGWRVRSECRHLERSPREYLPRFHYDTITHDPDALRFLIDLVGSERVLLGSDYCFDMGYDQPVDVVVQHTGLTEAQRGNILLGNAARLLRMAPTPQEGQVVASAHESSSATSATRSHAHAGD
jgi:aminocarboxymuconate-semialdehyde decarboxylase